MKETSVNLIILGIVAILVILPAAHAELLFQDNFDVSDTSNFDGASLTGRLTGSLSNEIKLASVNVQQYITSDQLRMRVSTKRGRVRFQTQSGDVYYDWAGGSEGAAILAAGGLRVEFDLTTPNTTNTSWISCSIGHDNDSPVQRIDDAGTDYGLLFRCNGGTERYDNGSSTTTSSFTATNIAQHVVFDFSFTSFADGSNVDVTVTIGSTEVDNYSFTWAGNAGKLHMELETAINDMYVNNYAISTKPVIEDTPLFSDSFDAPDTDNFDSSPVAGGRLGGILKDKVVLRSAIAQHSIDGNQLKMITPSSTAVTGRIRFHNREFPGLWYDWVGGTSGSSILSHNGFRVEFDWTTSDTNTTDWISFNIGFASGAEPDMRVTDSGTDYVIIMRGNGGTERYDNGSNTATTSFDATSTPRHVLLDFYFPSFADGNSVTAKAYVGGTLIDNYTFVLEGNNGELYMELETYLTGEKIEDFTVSLRKMGTTVVIQ